MFRSKTRLSGTVATRTRGFEGIFKTCDSSEVGIKGSPMSAGSKPPFKDSTPAQQWFLSLFLRSEGQVLRYLATTVTSATHAEDIAQRRQEPQPDLLPALFAVCSQ